MYWWKNTDEKIFTGQTAGQTNHKRGKIYFCTMFYKTFLETCTQLYNLLQVHAMNKISMSQTSLCNIPYKKRYWILQWPVATKGIGLWFTITVTLLQQKFISGLIYFQSPDFKGLSTVATARDCQRNKTYAGAQIVFNTRNHCGDRNSCPKIHGKTTRNFLSASSEKERL